MLIDGIPQLPSSQQINEVLTQIHSLFKSFQNTD